MAQGYFIAANATSLQILTPDADEGRRTDGFAICDGVDVEDAMEPMSKAFAALRLLRRACRVVAQRRRVNIAFDDEVGVGQNGFELEQNFQVPANSSSSIATLTNAMSAGLGELAICRRTADQPLTGF